MTVAIILPVLNGEHTLPRCLRSLQNQTHQDFELVAIDDGSTDNTHRILAAYPNKKHVITFGENRGIPTANNYARDHILTRGYTHTCWLAADDEWRPDKLRAQLEAHIAAGCDISYTDFTLVGEGGKMQDVECPDWDPNRYVWVNFIHGSTIMWSTKVLENLAWNESLRNCEDWDYGLTCIEDGYSFSRVKLNLCISYRHAGNISNKRPKEAYYHAKASIKHGVPLVVDAARMMRIGDPYMINGILRAALEERENQEND